MMVHTAFTLPLHLCLPPPYLQVCLAMCTLLGFTLPRVPNATLRLKFIGCSRVITAILEKHRGQV